MQDLIPADIERIKQVPIIPALLDVVCKTTGMGFAAVARVTENRWVACAVKDDIAFGLKPGGELELKTTICNEIRDSGKGVVINHVAEDDVFCNHHTPKMYGFQSYISIPIILKSGDFFGTLCAIDPRPMELNNEKTVGMFNLFADLISFHLQALDYMEASQTNLANTTKKLEISLDENRQYQHMSNHTLQEPLRKLRLFSDKLYYAELYPGQEHIKKMASKIHALSGELSLMVSELNNFSELENSTDKFEVIDLNEILTLIKSKLRLHILTKEAVVTSGVLHTISAIPGQINILFYHLINNALKFSKPGVQPVITVQSRDVKPGKIKGFPHLNMDNHFCEILIEDNGIGIDENQLENIFTLFAKIATHDSISGVGIGLSQCRKIASNHGGEISVSSEAGKGSIFSIILPVERTVFNA